MTLSYTILHVLSESAGIDLEFNALGFCSVPWENGMMLRVLELPDLESPLLVVEIAVVEEGNRELVGQLLEEVAANGLTGETSLTCDPETGLLTARLPVPRESEDAAVFETMLSDLLYLAEQWRRELPFISAEQPQPQQESEVSDFMRLPFNRFA